MGIVNERNVIDCYVNPDKLREIANKMEEEYEESMVGDTLNRYHLGSTEQTEIYLRIDQGGIDS